MPVPVPLAPALAENDLIAGTICISFYTIDGLDLNFPHSGANGNFASGSVFYNITPIMFDLNTAVFSKQLPEFLFFWVPVASLAIGILA